MAVLLQYAFTTNLNPTTVGGDVTDTAALNTTAGNPDPENYRTDGGFATDPALQLYPVSGATSTANAYAAGGYIQFALSAAAGKALNLTSLAFKAAKNGATARGWAARCSVDAYAGNIGGAAYAQQKTTWEDVSIDLSGASYQGLASITFRVCAWGPDNSYSGWLDDITVNGTVDATSTSYPAAGTVAGVSGVSGAVTAQLPTSGTVAGTSGVSGTVYVTYPAEGSVAGTSAASGTVYVAWPAAGSVAGVSGVSGAAIGMHPAAGTVGGTSAVSGAVTAQLPTSGTAAGVSGASGAVIVTYPVGGTVNGVSGVSGAVTAVLPTGGAVAGVSGLSGAAIGTYPAAGTAAGTSGVSGAVTANLPTTGTVAAVSGVSGAATTAVESFAASGQVGVVSGVRGAAGVGSSVSVTVNRPTAGTVAAASAVIAASTALRVAAGIAAAVSGASADPFVKGKPPAAGTVYVVSGVECDATLCVLGSYRGRHGDPNNRAHDGGAPRGQQTSGRRRGGSGMRRQATGARRR